MPGSVRGSAFAQSMRARSSPAPVVSGRWLLSAIGLAILGAAGCAWGALCLLFWQGSWQLLYHPAGPITRTPASLSLPFDSVAFATTAAGEPRLKGWWIPAAADAKYARYTVLFLHGQNGNLSDTVDELAAVHALGLNVFAFDYRGYGQSLFERPSEARWREDAESALSYLTATRHIAAASIVIDGKDLGANLALEIAASHPELAGVILESPLDAPTSAIFNDPRARMVPGHLLVRDKFDSDAAAGALKMPSLWLSPESSPDKDDRNRPNPAGYDRVAARKTLTWLSPSHQADRQFAEACTRWLDDLPAQR